MTVGLPRLVIVSDLHIGLPYFRRNEFLSFLNDLSCDFALILNGDTIDDPYRELSPDDQAVVDRLRDESRRRKIYWVYGNHDANYRMPNPRGIVFAKHVEIGERLLVVHGHGFDGLMPKSSWLINLFHAIHQIRIRLGAHPVHVAEFAKKWFGFLYKILTELVKRNAVQCAVERGFKAITCGHVHCMEDSVCGGVRYLNTASWTEEPLPYIELVHDQIRLRTTA